AEGQRLMNINRRTQPERKLVIDIPLKLKPRLIDHSEAQNLRVADLNGVLSLIQVVSDGRQRECPQPRVLLAIVSELVSRREAIGGRELHINSRVEVCTRTRIRDRLRYARDH